MNSIRTLSSLTLLCFLRCNLSSAEFNFEVGLRVHERITEVMDKPQKILELLSNYRSSQIFPNGLQAPDRDAFFGIADALLKTFPHDMLYYALEDGTFAGQFYSPRVATYREPGNSAYHISNNDGGEVQKYFMRCVDETGTEVPCAMKAGDSYIECVDGCSLEECKDDVSQRNCSALNEEEEKKSCVANIKWCKSYEVKKLPDDYGSVLGPFLYENRYPDMGFIPRSYYCLDKFGIPTQEPGTVSKFLDAELGNCYYQDGETPVNRSISGDYAYCGGVNQCMQRNTSLKATAANTCSSLFLGAYRSMNYDPRYRSWYTKVRLHHKSHWTEPYIFFTNQEMGITLAEPMYSMDGDKKVFFGVLGLDYRFNDIASFLVDNYSSQGLVVAIIEATSPNYLIASSTGTTGVKMVLASDSSQPCPPGAEGNSDLCEAVRVPVAQLSGKKLDGIVSKAFQAQSEKEFPHEELWHVEVDGRVFALQMKPFSLTGINWQVLTAIPTEVQSDDTIMPGDSMLAILVICSILGAAVCLIFFILLVKYRHKRDVVYSDWRFTCAFIIDCMLLNLACLSFIGENTDELCLLRMWLLHFFFVSALAPLLMKTYRMYLLVGQPGIRRITISHKKLAKMTSPFLLVQLVILLVFTFVDPSKETQSLEQEAGLTIYRVLCRHDTQAFTVVQSIYVGGIILLGCLLSFKTRNLREDFGESKQLLLAMYNIALVSSILLIVAFAVDVSGATIRVLCTVAICWSSIFSSGVFVIPRLLRVRDRNRENDGASGSGHVTRQPATAMPQTPGATANARTEPDLDLNES